jgi:hypothetical protein
MKRVGQSVGSFGSQKRKRTKRAIEVSELAMFVEMCYFSDDFVRMTCIPMIQQVIADPSVGMTEVLNIQQDHTREESGGDKLWK